MNPRIFGVAALALSIACGEHTAPTAMDAASPSFDFVNGPTSPEATQVVTGPIGPGAIYSLHRPANWNGDLVLFAHGAVPPTIPPRLPPVPVRDSLLARGYAFAYSSRSETGVAIKDGVQRTRQLRGLFVSAFGPPAHTYMIGNSLGGEIAQMLAEKNPELLDGALLMSAPVGGLLMEFDYVFNVRVLYEYYFPGVIPGDALHVPRDRDFDPDIGAAVTASLQSDPERAMELAGIEQIDIHYANFPELINAIVGALRPHWNFTNDILDRTQGHSFFDNTTTRYTGSTDDVALNAGVGRFASTPDAENHWEPYEPDGRLTVPLLTLHGTRDFFAPLRHEATYAALVASQGASDRLVQRTFNRFGHGMFTIPEQLRAFDDLVRWVETGSRPLP